MMPFWETDRVKYIVALAGNIGAAKSSLTSRLAQRLVIECEEHFEFLLQKVISAVSDTNQNSNTFNLD